jgi:aspartate/methionine/tyrosine aminotransferase
VQAKGGITLLDEIYLGLSRQTPSGHTGPGDRTQLHRLSTVFSKYFNMNGWRLGWMVVPTVLVRRSERLAQNLFICPARWRRRGAGLASSRRASPNTSAGAPSSRPRRDWFIPQLQAMGLPCRWCPTAPSTPGPIAPTRRSARRGGSWDFAFEVMRAPTSP